METAVGAATWLVGKVLNQLSDDLVAAYVASSELSLNSEQIKADLMYTHGLLHASQGRDDNTGLKGQLEQLTEKADEAEDALDELHYFMIQDKLDGTQHASSDLGGGLQETIRHGRNAVRHTSGNWLSCFSCCRTKDDVGCAAATVVTHDSAHINTMPDSGNGSGHVDNLPFDRVAISTKIKSAIEDMHSKCLRVSDLLKIPSHSNTPGKTVTPKRPVIGSTVVQDKLYGRIVIFEQTIKDITSASEPLSILPIVGPGGIGKTTFTQHIYNDKRSKEHFTVRVWVCVSTDFDVLKLTQQIHSCIPETKGDESNIPNGTTNLDQHQISIAHKLRSKRFLIILDDMWKCDSDEEWKILLAPFTKGDAKGSMVLVTTRFPKIEEKVKKATIPINLQGLDPHEFLEFFQACVFGENIPDQQYDELIDIGREIAAKLKCSPLAAKTVARLLKKNLSWEHWRKVLENNEWKNQTNNDDIMPALKISYDCLPFHLKQCFSYFGLFPEDHRFRSLEITRFWTAIGIIDSSCKNKNYLEELVENGFLVKVVDDDLSGPPLRHAFKSEKVYNDLEDQSYTMHDLLHELSRSVSSEECVNISSLSFSVDDIPQSVRHLSITVENIYDENFRKEMAKLNSRIKIGNLHTLMIFKQYGPRISHIFKDTFDEIEGLRVLFLLINSPECLPKNFSKLLHLRYLKIRSSPNLKLCLPTTLSRFYHLSFLDLQDWQASYNMPKYINRLVNLRHFIAGKILVSNVPEVGKIKHLEELKGFHVKKESFGFELEELGKLPDLRGELTIYNLETVVTKEEATKANLASKRNLKRLVLVWGTEQLAVDADVVDGFHPHDNLRELAIKDRRGAIGPPSWLFRDIPIKHLEFLTLKGVSWSILPPFGHLPYLKKLWLKKIGGLRLIGPDLGFKHLKEVHLEDMPDIEEWVVGPNCHLFPVLENIKCDNCPKIFLLPFLSEYFVPCGTRLTPDMHYPSLCALHISECPRLSLPPMPHTSTLTSIKVRGMSFQRMEYTGDLLYLHGYSGALAFHNMGRLERIHAYEESVIPWTDLKRLTSLRDLKIDHNHRMESMALLADLTSLTSLSLMYCDNLTIDGFNPLTVVNLKSLVVLHRVQRSSIVTDLLSEVAMAKLLQAGSFQLEYLEVSSISAVFAAPICSLLASTLRTLKITFDQWAEGLTEEEEKALQLLTSLRSLYFDDCRVLTSLPQGLHTLLSLRELDVNRCYKIELLPKGGLLMSLQKLTVTHCTAELREQAISQGTNPNLEVHTDYQ